MDTFELMTEENKFEEKYNTKIPVIAAGGIYTGADMKEIMDLGASGVQMGTRFVTTEECDASMTFKQTYIDSGEEDMEIINNHANAVSSMTAVNFSEMKISSNPVETLVAFSIGAGIGMTVHDPVGGVGGERHRARVHPRHEVGDHLPRLTGEQ